MTKGDLLACLTDRPCKVCKFHRDNGCCRYDCVFEEEPKESEDIREKTIDLLYDYRRVSIDFHRNTLGESQEYIETEIVPLWNEAIKALEDMREGEEK